MMEVLTQSDGAPGVSLETVGEATLVVQLSGAWRLQKNAASVSPVQKALETSHIRCVRFDAKALTSWDSSILIFLTKVTELCSQRNIITEREGLPDGIRRLLELAEIAPSKKEPNSRRIGRPFWPGSVAPRRVLTSRCQRW